MMSRAALALALSLGAAVASRRRVIFWVEPYANLTSVTAYTAAWSQFGALEAAFPGGVTLAGSAYALKPNGSLGYASTAAGEGLHGDIMERFGFAAMRALKVRTVALVYITHSAAIAAMLQNPQPFIDELLARCKAQGLDGLDLDYEPQGAALPASASAAFMGFLSALSQQMLGAGLTHLSIDIGGCPSFFAFDCAVLAANASAIPGLLAVNTMDSFGATSAADLARAVPVDGAGLNGRWAPGFEPNNPGQVAFASMTAFLASPAACATPAACPRTIATWEVRESNTGPQPQWLFDAVGVFLAAP